MLSRAKYRWMLLLIPLVILAWLFQRHLPSLIGSLSSFGALAPMGFLLLFCLTSILCIPVVLLVLAGGVLFGPVAGTILNVMGATAGAVCGFCISRYWRKGKSNAIGNIRIQNLITQVENKGWKSVALLRLTPAVPYNLVNYALGLTRIRLSHYALSTMIFIIPNKVIITCCGYYGVNILEYARVMQFFRRMMY